MKKMNAKIRRGPKELDKSEKKIQLYFMVKKKHAISFTEEVKKLLEKYV
jgi:hypothetical protein